MATPHNHYLHQTSHQANVKHQGKHQAINQASTAGMGMGQSLAGNATTMATRGAIMTNAGPLENCVSPCRGPFFTDQERDFAALWTALWSGLCCISTLTTLTTFIIDTQRFKYPERPIVFLSACYFAVSLGYLTRTVLGHEAIACDGPVVKYSTSGPDACTLVFLLVYFFGMASSLWWVILTFTWFLAAGLKWGNEAIASYAAYYHLAAWIVPTIQSVAVIVSSGVDGDPIAGICYAGNMNSDNLKIFVLIPLFAYLFLGTLFLLCGFVSLFRIRKVIKRQGGSGASVKADKLEKLMIRIGIFSVLYTVPASVVLGCHIYESSLQVQWLSTLACPCEPQVRPLYSVVMLKYFMALAVGITSGVWIWSNKTVESWKKLWRRICGSGEGAIDRTGAGTVLIKQGPPMGPPGCFHGTLGGGNHQTYVSTQGTLHAGQVTSLGSMASASHHLLHTGGSVGPNIAGSCCKQSLSHV